MLKEVAEKILLMDRLGAAILAVTIVMVQHGERIFMKFKKVLCQILGSGKISTPFLIVYNNCANKRHKNTGICGTLKFEILADDLKII